MKALLFKKNYDIRNESNYFLFLVIDPNATISTISSTMITNNATFVHCQAPSFNSYYQTFRVNVAVFGTYTFIGNSSIDIFGYMYKNNFDPNSPTVNLIARNDLNISKTQNGWTLPLQPAMNYYLVVATYIFNVTGLYNVKSYGPQQVTFTIINVTSSVNGK